MGKLLLRSVWSDASNDQPSSYTLTLINTSRDSLHGLKLHVSGPGRIDPSARLEGGTLVASISNHTVLAPPAGGILKAGAIWNITAYGLKVPLRHYNDGVNNAYVTVYGGDVLEVAIEPAVSSSANGVPRSGAVHYPIPLNAPETIAVIPWPNEVRITGQRQPPAGFHIELEAQKDSSSAWAEDSSNAAMTFSELCASLFPAEGIIRPIAEGGERVTLMLDPTLNEEAYRLCFTPTGASVQASDRSGLLYGLVSLGQIWRAATQHPETYLFPVSGVINDAPAMTWRGCMLDVARHFYTSSEVQHWLRIMAWHKLNRFHWHLTEDEGWRIQIDAYPELTTVGAWRGDGEALPALLGSGAARAGGYYTKQAVRHIVAYAATLGISVIPEFDIPGHSYAALLALPWLRDPAENNAYESVQAFTNNCLNPAREETYIFVNTVLKELIELFPDRIIHIGADEVPDDAWSHSPQAQALLKILRNEGAADNDAAVLQAYFLKRVQSMLREHGIRVGAWQEAAHGCGIDNNNSYLIGWREVDASRALVEQGYHIVVSPGQAYYLDMAQSGEWAEPGAGWAGWAEPQKTYQFDPFDGIDAAQHDHVLGVQACIWSEPMANRRLFDRLIFPRLSAVAEAGWTTAERKSWTRFKASVGLMPILYGHWSEDD